MATYYTVVQFVPDALADERINIGVIACDENAAASEFLNDWHRVRCFSGWQDTTFLREFAQKLAVQIEPVPLALNGALGQKWDLAHMEHVSREWGGSIQFTPPRASLQPATELIDRLAGWYLRETGEVRTRRRDKRHAVKLAADAIRDTVALKLGRPPSNALPQRFPVQGQLETQILDLVIKTKKALCGVQAVSFEIRDLGDLRSDLGAAKWAMWDIRQKEQSFPLAVVHFPPQRVMERTTVQEQLYLSTAETMSKMSVEFVAPQNVADWADRIVEGHIGEWREWLEYARPVAH